VRVRNGKGSQPRKFTNRIKYEENYDAIFRRKDQLEALAADGDECAKADLFKETR
jgi:hypothetical protein